MKIHHFNQIFQSQKSEKESQNTAIFQDILAEKSAQIMTESSDAQKFEELATSFQTWKSSYMMSGISMDMVDNLAEHSDKFLNIMEKAVKGNGYDDPQKFVSSLSSEELETLRAMSSLADDIDPSVLDKEGALNLILPRNAAQDLDNDGFVMRGIGRGWSFPPPNAPDDVKLAWNEATTGMSLGDKMKAMTPFMPIFIESDHSKFVNPYAAEDFSYTGYVNDRLEALDYFKAQTDPQQYKEQKEFLTRFLNALNQA